MVRFMKINPKHSGGMIKTLKGMVALKRRGAGVRPQIGMFKQLTVSSTVKPVKEEISGDGIKKKQSYKSLKFNL
jgi:hypothetical protein